MRDNNKMATESNERATRFKFKWRRRRRRPLWPSISDQSTNFQQVRPLDDRNGPQTTTREEEEEGEEFNLMNKQENRKQQLNLLNKQTQTSTALPSLTARQKSYLHFIAQLALVVLATLGTTTTLSTCLVVRITTTTTVSANQTAPPATSRARRTLIKRATGEIQSAKLLEVDAITYLQRYGYMNESATNAGNLISEDSFHEAVMTFQRFAGIPETGNMDSVTVRLMQMPRCGNKDRSAGRVSEEGKRRRRKRRRRRRKRYALQGSKWRRQELTYRISQYPTRFLNKKHEVDNQIEKAFRIWSQVAPIDFVVKREGRVHIDIKFASGEHGDGDPFDGPGNTLAHAYFPQYGGDAHFDDQEYWTVDSYAGTNIFQVAAHELGHSLGLGHSSVREALMAPFYQKYKPNFKLHADDVLGIQALYGEKGDSDGSGADPDDSDDNNRSPGSSTSTTTTTTTTTTEAAPPRRRQPPSSRGGGGGGGDDDDDNVFPSFGANKPVDLCVDSKIDAITRTEDGNTYVFRGQHYWQIKNEGLANNGLASKISQDWPGLPGNLDAALTWSDGKTFFFKGDKYWRFFNKKREPGYPKQISAGFAGIPNNIDAAFVWGGNGKTYFFKRDKYWRFDSKQEPPVSSQYPKSIKNWSGLPTSGLDAAFKWDNGMTYFFKEDNYWRFDDREFEVDTQAKPPFPRSTGEWWFGCTNSNLPIRRRPTASALPDNDDQPTARDSSSAGSSSMLMFHRKPNLAYDTSGGSSSAAPVKPAGTSISRSILTGLSSLLPSSFGSSSAEPGASSGQDDWSFHRGVGEEVRRLLRRTSDDHRSRSNSIDSRWSFPLGSSSSSSSSFRGGEQSLSELRMRPEDHQLAPDEQNKTMTPAAWLELAPS